MCLPAAAVATVSLCATYVFLRKSYPNFLRKAASVRFTMQPFSLQSKVDVHAHPLSFLVAVVLCYKLGR